MERANEYKTTVGNRGAGYCKEQGDTQRQGAGRCEKGPAGPHQGDSGDRQGGIDRRDGEGFYPE